MDAVSDCSWRFYALFICFLLRSCFLQCIFASSDGFASFSCTKILRMLNLGFCLVQFLIMINDDTDLLN